MRWGGLYASFTTQHAQPGSQGAGAGPEGQWRMDEVRDYDEDRIETDHETGASGVDYPRIEIGSDERRLHVRAYNHWQSLLHGRDMPAIAELDPASIAGFAPRSVLLDFSADAGDPAIVWIGEALRDECRLDGAITHVAQVPARSLLSRLTGQYRQTIATRAPVGFEAEFTNARGNATLYRGILMPFSSGGDSISHIYGVINWKELVDGATQTRLDAEIAGAALAPRPAAGGGASPWPVDHGTGPGPAQPFAPRPRVAAEQPAAEQPSLRERFGRNAAHGIGAPTASLTDQLILAQQTAAAVRAADLRTRATLYRALARAHDFAAAADADPAAYEALLDQAGIAVQLRAPMTPVVKLVFGADYDKTRLTEYAAVLAHARRLGIGPGELTAFLEGFDGGIKGVVKAERDAKRPALAPRGDAAGVLDRRAAIASVAMETGLAAGAYVVLVARAGADGTLEIVAAVEDGPLTRRAMRQAAE